MPDQPNLILITADDMNWDALKSFGGPVADATPNIDRLASEGMRFNYGHVQISVCQPSRSVMMTGRYPHLSGGEGFYPLRYPDIPILPGILRDAGYTVGILGKVLHSTPYWTFRWDLKKDIDDLGHGRNPGLYRQYAKEFIDGAKASGKPFFLMANSHDPHRPFYGNDDPSWYQPGDKPEAVPPSRTFQPSEVTTPGFLPDLTDVRLEISEYYNSVRRCDDTVGAVLDVLEEAGLADNTLVMYLSDNAMAFPYAKTNCYLQSTKTPWIVRWPHATNPGAVDDEHFISGIDILPTFLDAAGIQLPQNVNGRTFLPLLQGRSQAGRDCVFTQFYQTVASRNYPMFCIQNKDYGYIFNPWSNGTRIFKNESQHGRTFAAMEEAAKTDPSVAQRVELFIHRVLEEFYDFGKDPDALNNLIDDPAYKGELRKLQLQIEFWMAQTHNMVLNAFKNRYDPDVVLQYQKDLAAEIGGTYHDDV